MFEPLSLLASALKGAAWLLLGAHIAAGRAQPRPRCRLYPLESPRVKAGSPAGVLLLLFPLLAACDAGAPAEAATPVPAASEPAPPEGWRWVAGDDGGLRLSLPPWLQASDTRGAIFAHEAPAGAGLQLLAEGPRQVEPQPALGEDLRTWMAARLADVGAGQPIFRDVLLPAGPSLMLDRIDRPGTTTAWRHRAWAIVTQAGVVFLWIDGPPSAWDRHLDDVARIPMFLQLTM
jgi:hypothetical protein